jgi:preprotein translocase subunit SecA
MIRNPVTLRQRIDRLRGVPIDFDLSRYDAPLAAIAALEPELQALGAAALTDRARELADEARGGTPLDALQARAFALVREAARRALGQRPFDVQVVAGLALHAGNVVEMQTGEGKTLAAVMPAFLNALTGRGLHVLTFNDYLARRDAEWMGPVYRSLGLAAGWVQGASTRAERRAAYGADVTYVTAKEAGFDHLRDLLAPEPEDVVHRPFHLALLDEADSLLIDEARAPLVVAGSVEGGASSARQLAEVVAPLRPGADFETDAQGRNVELTEQGLARVERALGCGSLHEERNYALLTELNCALHARALLRRDVDYIVRDGRVELVDEFTGRVVKDRHWPDGLQAALEAKEGLERRSDGRVLGSITLQHFLGLYPRLCGMTGTAQDAARELEEFYELRVVVVPTHRPLIRIDRPDVVFTHREAKEDAVVREVARVHASGRPLLVGTVSVAESERLAARLRAAGVACEVLNAKNDAHEARIVAGAGARGAVTLSTNMAGRGTDIRLGGADEADRQAVARLGGLYVIGTNRHESRRVDLQLRGRAGRQGDPGESRFFLSLDDDMLVRFGIRDLVPKRWLPARQEAPVESAVLRREIERAQRIVDGQNLEIRRTLWRYATPVEEQRRAVQERRQALLRGEEQPSAWRADRRAYDALVARAGEHAVRRAERAVTLFQIDACWRDHLEYVAYLREGIHLVRLGGDDPLMRFKLLTSEASRRLQDEVERGVMDALSRLRESDGELDPASLGLKGPSATWTYLVNDDPFRNQLGSLLTGPGHTTFAIGAAIFATPLFLLLALVDRFAGKRARRVAASPTADAPSPPPPPDRRPAPGDGAGDAGGRTR